MYLLEKYNLVLSIQPGLSSEWLEFSVEIAYELAYAQRGVSVTSKGMQTSPGYFYMMYLCDLLNLLKSKPGVSSSVSLVATSALWLPSKG